MLLDGTAFVGELPANPQAGLRAVAVLFMPWAAGQRAAEIFETGVLTQPTVEEVRQAIERGEFS